MYSGAMPRLMVTLGDLEYAGLQKVALKEQRSLAFLIREAVRQYLAKRKK